MTSSTIGRMIELAWAIGGEDLGELPCDGMICATPSGSTAYNLSNGGPVLVWGLDAMAITFVAPHSLHARPLVVPRGLDLAVDEPDAGRRPATCSRTATLCTSWRPASRSARDLGAAQPAGDAAREHVLPPLPRRLRFLIVTL